MISKKILEKKIGLPIKNLAYFELAFIHRSYLNEADNDVNESNERLEFLGDSILQFISSRYLYENYPEYPEGQLTNLRSKIVDTQSLSYETKRLKLHEHLLVSKGEKETVNESRHMQADTFEAVLGAIYLDSGIIACDKFLINNLFYKVSEIVKSGNLKDPKSRFQEYSQNEFGITPTYNVISESGPDHNKTFAVGLYLGNKLISEGKGNSKRNAQQNAAQDALNNIESKTK